MDPWLSVSGFDSLYGSATFSPIPFHRFEFLWICSFWLFLSFVSVFLHLFTEFVAKESCESWNLWNSFEFFSQFRGFLFVFAYLSLISLLFLLLYYILLTPSSISTVSLFLIDLFLLLLLLPSLLRSVSRLFPSISLLSSSLSFPLYLFLLDFLPFPAIMIISGTLKMMILVFFTEQVQFRASNPL